jgi:CubicO group peptidase (beta-lactamase class C family)
LSLEAADALIREAIEEGVFPGACYAVSSKGTAECRCFGHFTYNPTSPPVTLDTMWDLASVSKVVGTTTAAMRLYEEGVLDLQAPVASVVPEFGQNGKERITFTNLLVHDSGLVAFRRYHEFCSSPQEIKAAIYGEELTYPTGTQTVYSDLSMIVVAEAIQRLTRQSLDEYLRDRVFMPLGMSGTTFNPAQRDACAPTERNEAWRGDPETFIQGEVHDPTAFALGGVAGHAGLFSTLGDLVAFMSSLIGDRVVSRKTWKLFTTRGGDRSTRALGWDTKSEEGSSAGHFFGARSFGHTGYTGTSVWCDPDREAFAILLTNRVHPTSENIKIIEFRPRFHDAVAQSL